MAAVIRLVLFDIDGTLIRSGGAGVRAFKQTFATEFGLPEATDKVVFSGRTDVSLVRQIFRANQIADTRDNFDRFFGQYPFWLDHFLHRIHGAPIEGVLDFISGLQAAKNTPMLGLLTGNIRLGAELKLRRHKLWHLFATGAFADDNEDRNCIASIARDRGCKLLGRELKGEEIVVIGDTPHDVTCGQSIGAKVLAVATGGTPEGDLAPHKPTWLVKDLTKMPISEMLA